MRALRGSCLCGGVRFEIAGPLDAILALPLPAVPEGAWGFATNSIGFFVT
jgi:hypothetical protein